MHCKPDSKTTHAAWRDFITASKWFFRGLKHGDWLWLVVAIFIASLSVTLVKQLGDSVEQSMLAKAANSLGADLVVRSSRPIDDRYQQHAEALGLETRQTISVVTMALANEQFQLISLKGVSKPNPYYLPAGQSPIIAPQTADDSHVWIEQRLQQQLNLAVGDRVTLGVKTFHVKELLETNALINPMSQFAPQAQVSLQAFMEAKLLGPGSRATYELEVSGDTQTIQTLQAQWQQLIESQQATQAPLPWTLISAKAPSEDLGKTLDRAWFFLDLASLAAVLIAGMSILIASRFYLQRWQNTMALLRAYGANNHQMLRLFAGQLFWLSFFSSLLGAASGVLLAYLLVPTLEQFFQPFVLTSPTQAFIIGLISGVLVLWSFAWHALIQALQISPMRLLRSVPKSQSFKHWGVSFLLLLTLIVLMIGLDWLLWVLVGGLVLTLTLWLGAQALIKVLEVIQSRSHGWQKIAISSLLKEKSLLRIQLISVGVVLFVLLLMTFVRQDLLQTWQQTLPDQAPNVFVMNIQPDQSTEVAQIFEQYQLQPELVAMVRGRLVAVNDQTLSPSQFTSGRAQRLLQREANIAIMPSIPAHNTITQKLEPSKTSEQNTAFVSVEQGIAELFGINLGDQLTFSFQGQSYTYIVNAFREVEWQSFQLNFFFILQPSPNIDFAQSTEMSELPVSFISNFYLPAGENATPPSSRPTSQLTQQLAQQTPGVLLIDVSAIMQQVQEIMEQASWAVSSLYLFTLVASVLVLFSATLASQQNRLQSWFLLRSLGATQSTITKVGLSEFILVGFLAGILAASFAQISSWLISAQWFGQTSPFAFGLWLSSLALGVFILLAIAWLTQRRYLKLSALQLKRLVQN